MTDDEKAEQSSTDGSGETMPLSPSWSSSSSSVGRHGAPAPSNKQRQERSGNNNLCWCRCRYSLTQFAFMIGSLCATVAAIIDLKEAIKWGNDDCDSARFGDSEDASGDDDDDDDDDDAASGDDDDDDYDDAFGKTPLEVWNLSKNLYVISTIFYLLDSFVQSSYGRRLLFNDLELERMPFPAIFGIAALFDLLATALDDDYMPWPAWYNEVLCVTLFQISSILTIYVNVTSYEMYRGRRYYYYQENKLALLGDAAFFTGCVIDCTVAYYDYPDRYCAAGWIFVASCSVASAGMWFIDSILYTFAAGLDEAASEDSDDDESSSEDDDSEDDDDSLTHSVSVADGEKGDEQDSYYKDNNGLRGRHRIIEAAAFHQDLITVSSTETKPLLQ
jgi:hypothetical protein